VNETIFSGKGTATKVAYRRSAAEADVLGGVTLKDMSEAVSRVYSALRRENSWLCTDLHF
jgi:hypothetical protein